MTILTGILIGTLSLFVWCVVFALLASNRVHESRMDWTDVCECGGTDFYNNKCSDCGHEKL